MNVIVFLWTLSFTAPSFDASRTSPCPPGCRDTTVTTSPCVDVATYEVWWQQQSPAWVLHHAAMQSDTSAWTLWWPVVRAEAEHQLFRSVSAVPFVAGAHVSITMPDTLPTGRWWWVIARDGTGNRACMSNEATR